MALYGTSTYGVATYGTGSEGGGTGVVTLQELRDYVHEQRTSEAAALTAVLGAAITAVENYSGRSWSSGTVTETHPGGKAAVRLRRFPVTAVSSVTEDGAATTDYALEEHSGLLYKGATSPGQDTWAAKVNAVTVTYVAGAATAPDPVKLAILMTARSLWGEQTGGAQKPGDEYAAPLDLIPRMARMLLDSYRMPAF